MCQENVGSNLGHHCQYGIRYRQVSSCVCSSGLVRVLFLDKTLNYAFVHPGV